MTGESGAGPRRCAVIGARVLGVCLAIRLAEAGAAVTLLERDEPRQAATRSSFAWLNSNDKAPRVYHDLNAAGLRAWDGWPPGWTMQRGTGPPGTWSGPSARRAARSSPPGWAG